jgi:glycogen synthase
VAQLQARALLNLVPSTWDVFNFTAAEAMASGRPVVCSDKAGASELIEDGKTGFVYDGASPAALVDTIRRALSLGPERLKEVGGNARTSILSALDPERQARAHLAAYQAAIAAPRPNPEAIPAWFKELASPREPSHKIGHHLDQHPLSELAAHVWERALRKAKIKT